MRNLICRTCIVKCGPFGGHAFVNIFDKSENNKLLADMLADCTALKVEKNDGLPQYICNDCREKLTSSWSFRTVAIESNAKLRNPYIDREKAVLKSVPATETGEESVKTETTLIKLEEIEMPAHHDHDHDHDLSDDVAVEEELITIETTQLQYPGAEETVDPLEDVDVGVVVVPTEGGNGDELLEMDEVLSVDSDSEREVPEEVAAAAASDGNEENMDSIADMEENNVFITDSKANRISLLEALELPRRKRQQLNARCKLCDKSFSLVYYYENHAHQHTGIKRFKCAECGKGFMWQFKLKIHGRVHSDERPYGCDLCGKKFKFHSALRSHAFVHSEKRPAKCEECGKAFKNGISLAAHKLTHSDENAYVCEVCGKSFTGATGFRRHRLAHHGGGGGAASEPAAHSCSVCGQTYGSRDRLRKHVREHTGEEKKHKCEHCGRTFWEKHVRDAHLLRHTGEKPHSCRICGKVFRHASTLHNHMRVHTGETPFRCALCPAEFKYSHHLKNHTMRSHANE